MAVLLGTGTSMGVCKGHKRGVWCVKFSPVDKAVASSSADATIKLWSLTDSSCLKTFEGHDGSVLKCAFVCSGMQVCLRVCFLLLYRMYVSSF
jgi:U3 small nucleolar RNA-associated protein 13